MAVVPGEHLPDIWKEWTALACVSATLQRQVHYVQGAYTVRPNLFVVLVGAPASGKSTSLRVLFGKVFNDLCEPVFSNVHEKQEAQLVYDRYLNPESSADIVPPRHMLRGEATHAKIAQILPDFVTTSKIDEETSYGSSLAVVTSEFGSFMNKNDTKIQNLLTEAWDSDERYEKGTKGHGDNFIKGLTLTWIACATPDMFVENMPSMAEEQGLLSRIIPVYVPGNLTVQELEEPKLDEDKLESLRLHLGTIAIEQVGSYTFHADTKGVVAAWRDLEAKGIGKVEPVMQHYASRKLSHLIKMCMCYAAARRKELVIMPEDWESAVQLLLETEKTMPQVLRRFAMSESGRFADTLVQAVKAQKTGMAKAALLRLGTNTAKSVMEVGMTVDMLIKNGSLIADDDWLTSGRK